MIFRPFYTYETGCAGYSLGCGGLGKCAVVDALERRFNPLLALDRDAFIVAVADVPPKPAGIDAILRSNRGGAGGAS